MTYEKPSTLHLDNLRLGVWGKTNQVHIDVEFLIIMVSMILIMVMLIMMFKAMAAITTTIKKYDFTMYGSKAKAIFSMP